MSVLGNRAKETSQSTGDAGDVELDGPSAGFQSLVAAAKTISGDGVGPWTVPFFRVGGNDWEAGTATLTEGSPDKLTYDIPLEDSSNAGSRVDWGVGTTTVFIHHTAAQLYALIGALSTTGLIERTGDDAYAIVTVSAFIKTLLDDASEAAARATIVAQEDVITTRGDLVVGDASGDADRLAIGTAGQYVTRVGADVAWKAIVESELPLYAPRGYIDGLRMAVENSQDVNIAAGICRDSTNSVTMEITDLTKQIDATWAAGDDQGGLNAADFAAGTGGTEPATWYHVFVIMHTNGTVDAGFDKDVDASNLLADSGYTYYRRIGSVLTLSDGPPESIRDFVQYGDEFLWMLPPQDVSANTLVEGSSELLTLSVPPDVGVIARVTGTLDPAASYHGGAYLFPTAVTDTDADGTVGRLNLYTSYDGAANQNGSQVFVYADENSQIRASGECADGTVALDLSTQGWCDQRGKNA